MSRRGGSEVVVILWRDIPAQINGKAGADKHQVILPHRFQKAIDRAAMVAGKKTAQEYVGEWRRTSYPLTGELALTIDSIAASIEVEFTNDRLHALVDNGGWDPANPHDAQTNDPIVIDEATRAAIARDDVNDETDSTDSTDSGDPS
ncbi:MAG: virulence factor [Actinomycetota bacterium]|nr:virulence factor [Actinomycetota bacterium]